MAGLRLQRWNSCSGISCAAHDGSSPAGPDSGQVDTKKHHHIIKHSTVHGFLRSKRSYSVNSSVLIQAGAIKAESGANVRAVAGWGLAAKPAFPALCRQLQPHTSARFWF